jgi:DNA-binding CsgD family transcriptional regulator
MATQLFERERELGQIEALIEEAGALAGHVVVIEGPAGIGKSQLLAEARERAAASMATLSARASELERDFPFGVVRQLFEGAVATPDMRERALAGAAEPAAAAFGASYDPAADGGGASFAALHGLYWLALNLAEERPLLLAVDDIQWCDPPSLRFIAYLSRRLEGVPILLLATQRRSEPGTDPALLGEVAQDPQTLTLRPAPLTAEGVTRFVRARLGGDADDAFCRACHETTGGNPLLLRQLLGALESDGVPPTADNVSIVSDIGPRAVSRTVLLRLARLPQDAAAVAGAVAILGESAQVPAVAALAGADEERVAEMTGALARAEILRGDPPLGFVHPLVRDVIYGELPPGERELRHARAGDLLREAGAPPEQIATQLLNAPRRGEAWVARLLEDAGRAAVTGGAAESGVAYLRRALEEPPPVEDRPGLLLHLGLAEALVNASTAVEPLREAMSTHPDPACRGRAARELAQLMMFSPAPEMGIEIAREAAAALPPELDDLRMQLEAVEHTAISFGAGDVDEVRSKERYRTGVIPGHGLGTRMLQSMIAWQWTRDGHPADECARIAHAALADGQLLEGDHTFTVMGAQLALVMADREDAMRSWENIQASAHRRGSLFSAVGANGWLSFTLLRRGDLVEAERHARESLVSQAAWMGLEPPISHYPYSWLALVLLERGDLDGAEDILRRAGPPQGRSDGDNFARQARAELLLARGEAERALEACEDFRTNGAGVIHPGWAPWRSLLALALDRVERRDEGLLLAEEELDVARRVGAPGPIGRALRVLGTLRRAEGVDQLREAIAVLEGSTARLEHAKALVSLGGALRRDRQPSDAREPLRQGLELASVCGAERLAEDARSELYASGARPRSDALSGVEALTPSERRVADLAAGGDSNKDIAQTLYVTPKTVEVHLSNAYRKLGIRSRRELPAALG